MLWRGRRQSDNVVYQSPAETRRLFDLWQARQQGLATQELKALHSPHLLNPAPLAQQQQDPRWSLNPGTAPHLNMGPEGDPEIYRRYREQKAAKTKGFSNGGLVAALNPFFAYVTALKNPDLLPKGPEVENGVLPVPEAPGAEGVPVGLASLIPGRPGMLKPPQPAGYARGGIVNQMMLTREQRALLDAIAAKESAGRYNVIYGGERFSDYSRHPGIYKTITSGPNKGQKSSAAGRYQFLERTWNDQAKKLGLKDFSPENQDRAAYNLARETYGGNLDQVLASGDPAAIAKVGQSLRGVWTSLPGGIEQGTNTSNFVRAYQNSLAGQSGPPLVNLTTAAATTVPAPVQAAAPAPIQAAGLPSIPVSVAPPPVDLPPEDGGLGALFMMAAMSEPAAPPPVAGGAPQPKRGPITEEMIQATSQTPNVYLERLKKRRRIA